MMTTVDLAYFTQIRQRMRGLCQVARLPLRAGQWSGLNGHVQGMGTGNSLDFQDQRPYVPGDDPRHINWQAYARNGSYTMKLYRQEVSPRVDLIIDGSISMSLTDAKRQRLWELVWFVIESSLQLSASLKVYWVGVKCQEVPLDQVMADAWPVADTLPNGDGPRLDLAPLRPGALRVLVSDLLFPAAADEVLTPLTANRGRAMVLAPFCEEESAPEWSGNIDFEDAESGKVEKRRVPEETLKSYLAAYRRHFDLWREPAQKRGVGLARVSSDMDFMTAIRGEAVGLGLIELI
jgi:Protein of unknown function DUF58